MKIRQAIATSLAALAATAAFPALAQSIASASLTNLSYQLIDLDPYDGITPYLTFTGNTSTFAMTTMFSDPFYNNVEATDTSFGTVTSTAQLSNSDGTTFGSATLFEVTADTQAQHNSGSALAYSTMDFILSPHTRVIFTVNGSVNALPDFTEGGLGDALAQALLFGQVNNNASGGLTTFSSSITANRLGEERPLSALIDTQDQEAYGTLVMQSIAESASLAPVPEPGSLAMLAAGLAVLTGAARRRARRG